MRVKVRLELPDDLTVSDEQVVAAFEASLRDLVKGGPRPPKAPRARRFTRAYPQARVDASLTVYERHMRAMIDEIASVLSR